jgi:ankyrin repeat protein
MAAAGEGQLATVNLLLKSGVSPNDNTFGYTALASACRQGHLAVVRRLLVSGADPNQPGWPTPIDAAVSGGHVEIVRTLLASGASVREAELRDAAPNRELLRLLEKAYAAQPNEKSPEKLIEAARRDDTSELERLLAEEPDVNGRDATGRTALVEAIDGGRRAAVYLLLNNGADVNAGTTGYYPTTPLRAAIERGDVAIVRRLIRAGADLRVGSPLCRAAQLGNLKLVDLLLDKGAPPDDDQCSPLMAAAGSGRLSIVTRVLDGGADPKRAPNALHSGVAGDAPHVLRALMERGMDVDVRTGPQGITPLHLAVTSRSLEAAGILLDAGANVDARDASGSTPLMTALPNFGWPAYEPLRPERHGVDPHRAMIERLLEGGADVNAVDPFGRTVLAQAQLLGDRELVQLLRRAARAK